jgi:hypothetical protein
MPVIRSDRKSCTSAGSPARSGGVGAITTPPGTAIRGPARGQNRCGYVRQESARDCPGTAAHPTADSGRPDVSPGIRRRECQFPRWNQRDGGGISQAGERQAARFVASCRGKMPFGRGASCGCPSKSHLPNCDFRTPQLLVIAAAYEEMTRFLIAGGEGEIRTPGTRKGTPAFEAGAIDHSATSPRQ